LSKQSDILTATAWDGELNLEPIILKYW